VVQRLFDAMRTKDTTAMLALFDPKATLVGMRRGGTGPGARPAPHRGGVRGVHGRDQREAWTERAWNPQVAGERYARHDLGRL
jgi:hypothetical protein